MGLIKAARKDGELLADIAAAKDGEWTFHLWWLGQSGFLLKWNGEFLLFDPYLSDSLSEKYADTDKPHVRMSELAIDPARLDFVKVATSSHNHTDHLDAATLKPLAEAAGRLTLVLPEANLDFARERLGDAPIDYTGVDVSHGSVDVGPWEFVPITAAHNEVEWDEKGHSKFLGYHIRFGEEFSVYHSGDTLWHEMLVPELTAAFPAVALLPINGNKPERKVAGNLNGTEAAALAKAIAADLVIPCHYHMFDFNTEEPDEFVTACERLGQAHRVMRIGERLTVELG